CHHEQAGSSIFAALRIANHGAGSVIDLAFFSGSSSYDAGRFRLWTSTKLANESHRLISAVIATGDQILPNRHRTYAPDSGPTRWRHGGARRYSRRSSDSAPAGPHLMEISHQSR